MNNTNSTKNLTVYLFLDENLLIGLLLEKMSGKVDGIENDHHSLLVDNFRKSKEIQKLINELYNLPTKIVTLESSLKGALEKIKNRKEFERYNIDLEKIEKLEKKLRRNKYKRNGKEYHIKISGLNIHIITEDAEKKYIDSFIEKYEREESIIRKIFDNGDLKIIRTLVSYADERNGKGIYIFLTLDRRIIKKFSNYLSKILRRRIYILVPEDLYRELENLKNLKEGSCLQEILYILSFTYLEESLKRNKKNKYNN